MTSSGLSHDSIEELIAADALGGLDEAARGQLEREMWAHGADCAECRHLGTEYSEVAARLALSLDPIPLSPGVEDRLVASALEWNEGVRTGAAAILRPENARRQRPPLFRVRGWLVAAAAAVLAVMAGALGHSLAPDAPVLRAVNFPSAGGQHLAVVFEQGSSQAFVVGSNVASPPAGKVYELWFQPAAGGRMEPAGTFVPEPSGSVVSKTRVGPTFVALAVSVEPRGGSRAPTTPAVFQASV